MFYEKADTQRLYNTLRDNDKYSYLLITSVFDNYKQLSRNEFIILTIKWKKKVKELIHMNDVGYVINGGNIFVIVDNERKNSLVSSITTISFTKPNKSSIYSEVLELNDYELQSLMY